MSVLVKNMIMPRSCLECPMFNGHGCRATSQMFHPITNVAVRVDSCPLVEIETSEPADVVPVVHSRWVLGGYDDMYYVCEKCRHKQSEYYAKPTVNFCPNCGAKMDGKE